MRGIRRAWPLGLVLFGCRLNTRPPEVEAPGRPEATPSQANAVVGWWVSRELSGPGAPSVRQVQMAFNPDGSYESGAALVEGGNVRIRSQRGTFTVRGGQILVRYEDGRERTFDYQVKENRLLLKEGGAEARLERVTPQGILPPPP